MSDANRTSPEACCERPCHDPAETDLPQASTRELRQAICMLTLKRAGLDQEIASIRRAIERRQEEGRASSIVKRELGLP